MELSKRILIHLCNIVLFVCLLTEANKYYGINTVVSTTVGKIRGSIIENLNVSYYSFKGIPYAEPPVGKLRFQAPIPHHKWNGVRDALEHGSVCANKWGIFGVNNTAGGNEDCLFLNVYTRNIDGAKKSVMFWIHGGAFVSGSGNADFYGPEHLLKKDIVLVTINYRFSAFGFLSTGDKHAPGNQGLKDLVLGLKWVRDNIERFGGKRNDVTIFGHSAGAAAVHFLMLSDLGEGLFHKAILQSGTALAPMTTKLDSPLPKAKLLAQKLKLFYTDNKNLIEKLQTVRYEDIRDVETPVTSMGGFPWFFEPLEYVPSIEPNSTRSAVVGEAPLERLEKRKFTKIPIMIGTMSAEGLLAAPLFFAIPTFLAAHNGLPSAIVPREFGLTSNSSEMNVAIRELRKLYFGGASAGTLAQWLNVYSDVLIRFGVDRVARYHARCNLKSVFYYQFSFDGALNIYKKLLSVSSFEGASHGDELFYLFEPHRNDLRAFVPDARASLMRERMTTLWTNFAKYGNPTPHLDGQVITKKWKPYTARGKEYFDINDDLSNKSHPDRLDALNKLIKQFTGHI